LVSNFKTNALRDIPSTLNVDVRIHVTQRINSCLGSESGECEDSPSGHISEKQQSPTVSVLGLGDMAPILGRPDIHNILKEEVDATYGGRVGVGVCGSDPIVRATRSALGISICGPGAVMRGGASVSLFVESFGYA
jgi:hypothetical protein